MSYTPGLTGGENAIAFATGAAGTGNATPDTLDPAATPWATVPATSTGSLTTTGAVLLRGVPSSSANCMARVGDNNASTSYHEQANLIVIPLSNQHGYGLERSDDEIVLHRSAAATIKLQTLERLSVQSVPGPTYESTYPRYLLFRMGG